MDSARPLISVVIPCHNHAHFLAEAIESAVRGTVPADAALAALDHDVDALLEKRRWMLARTEASR